MTKTSARSKSQQYDKEPDKLRQSKRLATRSKCYIPTSLTAVNLFINFPFVSNFEHRAPFRVSVITLTIRHTVGLLWTSDQPVAETSTYTGQHNI
jgi:hypothetical protein